MHLNEIYEVYLKYPIITTDTRKIEKNSIFLALKGNNFNGNEFADKALELGAAYAIIDEASYKKDERFILVEDVLSTLQELAKHHRDQLIIPIIGITGTNGKTTSKELIHAVLKQKFKTFATKGNLNNHIGVPLSILSINKETEIAIIEMGANHQREIAFLCSIAKPGYGLITNVGKAHLEGFGSYEGVKKTKAELYDWLSDHKGTLFLQKDNPELISMANEFVFEETISYGFDSKHDISGRLVDDYSFLSLEWSFHKEKSFVESQLTGAYNAENILAAIAIGVYFGLNAQKINTGIANYRPENNRSQIIQTKKNTVICDYYNANVSSMEAALQNIDFIDTPLKKTVILGDMFELGDESLKEHSLLIEKALLIKDCDCIFVGEDFHKLRNEKAAFYKTTTEAVDALKKESMTGRLILLKASRGMTFEEILAVIE
jgi:UDP-N-acetylmuramoyl-tripeptide--D-alanyl-D-alanine ligase